MIKANFSTYGTYVTDSVYQWDINRELEVRGINLLTAPEIHFYNANMGSRAIVRQATLENGVAKVMIPNSILQEALLIRANVVVYEGDTRKTIETIEIPVIAKARPLDYSLTDSDEEIYSFNALENYVDNSIAKVDESLAEWSRIIGEYPTIPSRVKELEDRQSVKIVSGTYIGTGTVGEANRNTLTFDFTPKIVFITGQGGLISATGATTTGSIAFFVYVWGRPTSSTYLVTLGQNVSVDGNTMSWYATHGETPILQFNEKNSVYHYVAIG